MPIIITHVPDDEQLPYPRVDRQEVELLHSTGHYDGYASGICRFRGAVCLFEKMGDGAYSESVYAADDPDKEREPVATVEIDLGFWRSFVIHAVSEEVAQAALARARLWEKLVGDNCTFGPRDANGYQQRLRTLYFPEGPELFFAQTALLPRLNGDDPIAWFTDSGRR